MFTDGSFHMAIDHYRKGDFANASKRFNYIVDVNPDHWEARLYLAMSQIQLGDKEAGLRNLRHLADNCTDTSIRAKANLSLTTIAQLPLLPVTPPRTTSGAAAGELISSIEEDQEEEVELVWKKGADKKRLSVSDAPPPLPIKRRFFWQR